MTVELRPLSKAEQTYIYSTDNQTERDSGCIGHLRADFGSNGLSFFSSWWEGERSDCNSEKFKALFDDFINYLRENGPLRNRSTMSKHCLSHVDAAINDSLRDFGFRADIDDYSFLLRMNPNRGEYNLYCYCYMRNLFDEHMKGTNS